MSGGIKPKTLFMKDIVVIGNYKYCIQSGTKITTLQNVRSTYKIHTIVYASSMTLLMFSHINICIRHISYYSTKQLIF